YFARATLKIVRQQKDCEEREGNEVEKVFSREFTLRRDQVLDVKKQQRSCEENKRMVQPAQVRKMKNVVGGQQYGPTDNDGNCEGQSREQAMGSFVITPRPQQR